MATPTKTETEKIAPIIIKRVKKVAGGHHGGAWKVAYADFVTAMMAFFLLLWLLNVTTEQQKNAISNYFDPSHPEISNTTSGAGGVMGGTSVVSEGAMSSMVQSIARPDVPNTTKLGQKQGDNLKNDNTSKAEQEAAERQKIEEDLKKAEDKKFDEAKKQLEAEMQKNPELKELQKNLLIDTTPEGLRIQIVDDQGRSMFARGSAQMLPFMERLVQKVAEVISPLPNQISVRGHTDGAPYKTATGYDNWNLSADRAQSTRRVLVGNGKLAESRIANVVGRADKEHLVPTEPLSEHNRRISIVLLREDYAGKAKEVQAQHKAEEAKKAVELVNDAEMPVPHKSALPVEGLKNRTMKGVTTSSKRGAIIDMGEDTPPLEETVVEQPEVPTYVAPEKPAPTKVLEFD